jgi:hypothetical protein
MQQPKADFRAEPPIRPLNEALLVQPFLDLIGRPFFARNSKVLAELYKVDLDYETVGHDRGTLARKRMDHVMRIFFNPKTDEVPAVIEALEGASIPHCASDYKVERYDASGNSHMATFVSINAAIAATRLEQICQALDRYLMAGHSIKITLPGASFKVSDKSQLLEVADAIRKLHAVGPPSRPAQL